MKIFEKSSFNLVGSHVSDKPHNVLSSNNRRGGLYFMELGRYEADIRKDMGNIIHKDDMIYYLKDEDVLDLYITPNVYYGDYIHFVDLKLKNCFDMTVMGYEEKEEWFLTNFPELEDDPFVEDIVDKFYDSEYEEKINYILKNSGYDSFKFIDQTEGWEFNTIVTYFDVKVPEPHFRFNWIEDLKDRGDYDEDYLSIYTKSFLL